MLKNNKINKQGMNCQILVLGAGDSDSPGILSVLDAVKMKNKIF